ncbi:LYR motif-containing protein 1 [Lampetra fluviatilis]
MSVSRVEVLGLYRRVFRLARGWRSQGAAEPSAALAEAEYIRAEARALFRKNKDLVEPEKIKFCIEECKTRIELALHYKIPYPRPMNLPPMGLAGKQGRQLKTQERLRKQAKPIYLQSHDET